jgi:hypothetical protein
MGTSAIVHKGKIFVLTDERNIGSCDGCAFKGDHEPCDEAGDVCALEDKIWVDSAVAEYIKAIGTDPIAQTHEMETFAPLATTGGTKHDSGKPPMSLLDTKWLTGVAEVLGFGAKKYAAHNWRKGISYSRLSDAAMRHLTAFNAGEDIDPESGLPHLHHASCCLMFLSNMAATRPDLDDRWKPE